MLLAKAQVGVGVGMSVALVPLAPACWMLLQLWPALSFMLSLALSRLQAIDELEATIPR